LKKNTAYGIGGVWKGMITSSSSNGGGGNGARNSCSTTGTGSEINGSMNEFGFASWERARR